MDTIKGNFFYQTIKTLRQSEEMVLYDRLPHISPAEEKQVLGFLQSEYQTENTGYPYQAPAFDEKATKNYLC
jgi:hypothetical protein